MKLEFYWQNIIHSKSWDISVQENKTENIYLWHHGLFVLCMKKINILCPTTYLWDESKKQDFWINPVYLITVATSKQIFKKITFEFKEQFLSMKWVRHCSCHLYSNSKEPNHCPNISKSTVFTTLNVNNFVYFYTWHCKKKT